MSQELNWFWLTLVFANLVAATPIRGDTSSDPAKSKAQVAKTQIDRGLIKVQVEFSPNPVRLSDEPTLTLTIDSEQGVQVDKPQFADSISGFVVLDFRESLPEVKGDRTIFRQIYKLEPLESGSRQLDPFIISFTDGRSNGDGQRHSLETESLSIEVTSLLDSEAPSLDSLKGIAGPVEIPVPVSPISYWLPAGGLFAIVFGGAAWWLRARRNTPEAKPLTPQELAYLELDALIQEKLAETNVKLFYVRLTDIVRRYIEGTTGIHAPEQTTEEFLREIGRGQSFSGDERQRLKAFLESADLVKFAAQEPSATDIEQTFERAKAFIGLSAGKVQELP